MFVLVECSGFLRDGRKLMQKEERGGEMLKRQKDGRKPGMGVG